MTDINIGAISEALNDKTDRDMRNVDNTAGADAVIEYQEPTAENNYEWYRKYKSGWVEQGGYLSSGGSGNKTVNLAVEMADLNYRPIVSRISGASTTTNVNVWPRIPTLTTSFIIYFSDDTGASWRVSGMAA